MARNNVRSHAACPKCKAVELEISEVCEATESWLQNEDGVIVDNEDTGALLGKVLRVEAKCIQCDHQWVIRGIEDVTKLPNWPEDAVQEPTVPEVKEKPKEKKKETKNKGKKKVA